MSVEVDERGGATNVEMALLWTAILTVVLAVVQVALCLLRRSARHDRG